jgi:hypothetical protein
VSKELLAATRPTRSIVTNFIVWCVQNSKLKPEKKRRKKLQEKNSLLIKPLLIPNKLHALNKLPVLMIIHVLLLLSITRLYLVQIRVSLKLM